MRFALAASLLAALALATPADAAGLSGMGAALFGNTFHFPKANLPKPPVTSISAGGLKMELQHTKLSAIKAKFGGSVQTQGGAGNLANWLCYHTDGSKGGPAANTWFISNILGGGEFVMIVAVQAADPDKIPADCEAAPAKFTVPQMGIPGLGASASDLKAALGSASGNKLAYRADEPGADALGTALNAQYIAYTLSGGKVSSYGVGETSVPAPK